jgi:[ribosomal protein S5]-alanine N-acetyltransferase
MKALTKVLLKRLSRAARPYLRSYGVESRCGVLSEIRRQTFFPMKVLETDRLLLRRLTEDDAAFIMRLVNEASWLRFIGDKGVRTLEDAREYLRKGPLDMYARYGFGMYLVTRKLDAAPLGMCGLIKRDTLPDVDIGFAFAPESWGNGYAVEAAAAVLAHGRGTFSLPRIVAITSLDNVSSIRVLEKIGLTFERVIEFAPNDPVRLFVREF